MKKIVLLTFTLLVSSNLWAGTGSGKVTRIHAHEKGDDNRGVILFSTENNYNKAACSTADEGTEWAFTADTGEGQAMYGLLLMAFAANMDIIVSGKGDCADWSDRERPAYIRVTND